MLKVITAFNALRVRKNYNGLYVHINKMKLNKKMIRKENMERNMNTKNKKKKVE